MNWTGKLIPYVKLFVYPWLVLTLISVYWWWLRHLCTKVESNICVLFMTSICENAKMPDEVDRRVYSLGKIICVSLSGVDSDICLLMMTLTALYWCCLWYMRTCNDQHLCKCKNARWNGLANCFSNLNNLCTLDWCWLWYLCTGEDSDIFVLMLTLISV